MNAIRLVLVVFVFGVFAYGQDVVCVSGENPGPNVSCQGTRFDGVVLRGKRWPGIQLQGAEFVDVTMVDVDLQRGFMQSARWDGSCLVSNSVMDWVVGDGMVISGAVVFDLTTSMKRIKLDGMEAASGELEFVRVVAADCSIQGAAIGKWTASMSDFSGCFFSGSRFEGFSMVGGTMRGARFDGAEFSKPLFDAVNLVGANFTGAILRMATFRLVQGANVSFVGTDLRGAIIRGGMFPDANFKGAELSFATVSILASRGDFTGANLSNADLTGLVAPNARFEGADLTGANFSRADVSGADFTGAEFKNADFRGTKIGGAMGLPENVTEVSPPPRQTLPPETPTPSIAPTKYPEASETAVPTMEPTSPSTSVTPAVDGSASPTLLPSNGSSSSPEASVDPESGPNMPSLTATLEDFNDGSVCFPGDASVVLENGHFASVAKLSAGDRIRAANGNVDEVYFFGHRIDDRVFDFVAIETESDNEIVLSPRHLIYEAKKGLIAAVRIGKGDQLLLGNGERTAVSKTTRVRRLGLFNPHTLSGDIVVDGIQVSTYNAFAPPSFSHLLLLPERVAHRMGRSFYGQLLEHARPGLINSGKHLLGAYLNVRNLVS